jgi:O-acetylhomoserine (thiol)-lyase
MSAMTAFLILQGLETLPLRMEKHVDNARKLVDYLRDREAVEWVTWPELPDHPDHDLAAKLLPRGAGAVFSFGVRGGRAAGQRFIERLELVSHLANIGDAKTLVIHPASTTHHRMDAAALEAAGITEGLVRISVGIENIDDLIDDLAAGLHASQKA